jgi:hypothetical protein
MSLEYRRRDRALGGYSATKHIAMAVFGCDWKEDLLVMLTGYFDESGDSEKQPGFGIGGFVCPAQKWLGFNKKWSAVLDKFEVSHFHMKDFAHSNGEFKSWKGNEGKRNSFIKKLVAAARSHISFGACSNIWCESYAKLNREYELEETVSPYVLCALRCVDLTIKWGVPRGYKREQMRFVFEDGSNIPKGQLYEWMEREGFSAPIFEPKKSHRGLELADFSAWEHTKVIRRLADKDFAPFRKSLVALNKIPNESGVFFEQHIRAICVNNGIPRRGKLIR